MHAVLTFFTCGVWLPIWILHYCLHLIASGQNALLVATFGVPLAVALVIGGFVILGGIAAVSNQSKTTQMAKPTSASDDSPEPTEQPAEKPMEGGGAAGLASKPSSEPSKTQQKQTPSAVESPVDRMKRLADEERRRVESGSKGERERAEAEKTEKKAASYLKYAKKLIREGQTEKAKERLMEIIRDFPTTEAAKESKTLLESL
jgi:hypothetical protein